MSVCTYATDTAVNLVSQAEVDLAVSCTFLAGSLTVGGSDITNLDGLANIQSIGKYLDINDMDPSYTNLVNIFPSLSSIGEGISWYHTSFDSIDGFHALKTTGDNIDFWYNDNVQTITGFENLVTVGWSLEFGGNNLLTTIPAFESLTTIASSLFILDNPLLSDIIGFNVLEYVDWSFQINGNSNLVNFCGLYDYFTFIGGSYNGGGEFNMEDNGPGVLTSEQEVLDEC